MGPIWSEVKVTPKEGKMDDALGIPYKIYTNVVAFFDWFAFVLNSMLVIPFLHHVFVLVRLDSDVYVDRVVWWCLMYEIHITSYILYDIVVLHPSLMISDLTNISID